MNQHKEGTGELLETLVIMGFELWMESPMPRFLVP